MSPGTDLVSCRFHVDDLYNKMFLALYMVGVLGLALHIPGRCRASMRFCQLQCACLGRSSAGTCWWRLMRPVWPGCCVAVQAASTERTYAPPLPALHGLLADRQSGAQRRLLRLMLAPTQGVGFSVCAGLLNTLTALTHLRVAYHIPRTRAHALWVRPWPFHLANNLCSPLREPWPSACRATLLAGHCSCPCLMRCRGIPCRWQSGPSSRQASRHFSCLSRTRSF